MKRSVFVLFTLLIIFLPKYESLKILKKIKELLHPTSTTSTTTLEPDYEREEERLGTSTVTWEPKGQDVWETTTYGIKVHNSFSDKTPQQETDYISTTSTTTESSNIFIGGNKDNSSTSPTNDGSASPETPGAITILTIDNIYHNNLQPNHPTTTYDDINKRRYPTTQPTIPDNNYNKLQPDPLLPGSNPAGSQGKPTTQPGTDYNRQNLNGTDVEDIVFPGQSSASPTTQPGTISGDRAASVPTTTERPSGPVPVRPEDTRRVIKAPVKECDKGQKLDGDGKCRKITRR